MARLEEHLAAGWEFDVEVIVDAPLAAVAACLPRTLGQLSEVDERTTRLVGSTSNPYWYAEQLARIPGPFRIVRCAEVRELTRRLGRRLQAAADAPPI